MKRKRIRNTIDPFIWTMDHVADLCPHCGVELECRPYWPFPTCRHCAWSMALAESRSATLDLLIDDPVAAL